jgi:hypothetical protein
MNAQLSDRHLDGSKNGLFSRGMMESEMLPICLFLEPSTLHLFGILE